MFDRLVDNYTERATKNLSGGQRDDVRKELKSHIMDSAEALAAKQNKPVDEAVVREVIAKMGQPEEFASSYAPMKKSILTDRVIFVGVAIIVVFFLAVVGLWFIGEQVGHTLTIEHRADSTAHAAAGNVTIDLDDFSGNVDVVESATNDIEVAYDVYAGSGRLGDVVTGTTYAMEGDTLKVTSEAKQKNTGFLSRIHIGFYNAPGADATVKVPRDSRYKLDLTTSDGRVTVTALNGSSMTIASDDGSIEIDGGVFDRIDARTGMGSIKAKYDANVASFRSSDGSIDLESHGPCNTLSANTGMGSIKAKFNAVTATFRSSDGSIDLESYGPGNTLSATTGMGPIKAKYDALDATFESNDGSLELESLGPGDMLTASTGMGSITARYAAKKASFKSNDGSLILNSSYGADSVTATTGMGSINAKYNATKATFESNDGRLDLESYGTAGDLSANTGMGYIHVVVPDDTLFRAEASTSMGRIIHDSIPLVTTTSDRTHLVGYTEGGEGALKMKLKSNDGSIEISY